MMYRSVALGLGGLLVLLLAGGCGSSGGGVGPDVMVSPHFSGGAGARAAEPLAVAVKVVDARGNPASPGAHEVLAEGDKGKVLSDRPTAQVVESALASALESAGFTVKPDAPVTVEATITDFTVEATQFTHWGLPSERASTLDALGALVPGPVRPTSARAALTVVVRRTGTRLGFSHAVSGKAENKSDQKAVVERTVSEALTAALQQAIAQAGPDVEVATRAPATAKEVTVRTDEIARQQQTLQQINAMLAHREEQLADDRKALDAMRASIEEDRRRIQVAASTDKAEVERQKKQLEQERAAMAKQVEETRKAAAANDQGAQEKLAQLQRQQQELERKGRELAETGGDLAAQRKQLEQERAALAREVEETRKAAAANDQGTQAAQEKLAQLQRQQQELERKGRELAEMGGDLAARRKQLDEREQNLTAYTARLKDQAAANTALAEQLRTQQQALATREQALEEWKKQLESTAVMLSKPKEEVIARHRPMIVITDPPASRRETTLARVPVTGVAVSDRQIERLRVTVNGREIALPGAGTRGVDVRSVAATSGNAPSTQPALASRGFSFEAELKEGSNEIVVEATDSDHLSSVEKLSIAYRKGQGRVHIISIGINDYMNRATVPSLQYAVADASAVAQTLDSLTTSPGKQVRQILNDKANRVNLVEELFSRLPTEVRPEDTVIIFFSGHGAPDTRTDAQGNVETFLLPVDADPQRLFLTAIRMNDVSTILRRLSSERIVFLADTCYSGATSVAGARTVGIPGLALRGGVDVARSIHRPEGKGCAVITASTGSQVAQEKAEYKHGVFSYFVLEGLRGAADLNHDGNVTVDELYDYVRDHVSQSTSQSQTPQISRDPAAGEIVLSHVAR